ncbi:unnamed protein product [Penicillium olsonii]|uniref:Fibroin-3 related protein n=1 Tax=Penicillium olsonii TaxID=99116 RepID=A0A9W4HL41_PENOL|nr:unnamed protein product [Penicillium olsonii]CAG8075295.1 unnamed protein product [Penicillium olsonii]
MSPANIKLWARDTASDLESIPSTFSSWDKCMAKSYCKWPVIVGIIVGSVILLAVLACIFNCLCCGYQCCKCCCSCCCPSGRRRNKTPKHFDDPAFYQPTYHQPPPPAPNPTYQAPPAPPSYRGAEQTARFDAPKSPAVQVNEDALPEMPTWAGAKDKHVEDQDHHEDVEMAALNPPDRKQGAGTPGAAFSDQSSNASMANGYRGFAPTDPYARRSPGPALTPVQDPYARRSPGVPSPGGIDPYGRRSPGPAAALAAAQDPYGRRSPGPAAALAATQDPYGRRSPGIVPPAAAVDPYARRSPGPGLAYSTPDPYAPRSPGLASPMAPHNPYDHSYQEGYGDNYGAGAGYHAMTSPSPVAGHNPTTQYSPAPMALSTEDHSPTPGFQRQPSFGSSHYPPTYTSQPAYRGYSPGATSPPPAFSAPTTEYATYNPHGAAVTTPEPDYTRPPSLLQSGKKPNLNASSNF